MFGFPQKHRPLLISTIIFFITINTLQLWEGKLGIFAFLLMFVLVTWYLVMLVVVIAQAVYAIKEKGRDRQRLWVMGLGVLVLGLTTWKPGGFINWDALSGKDLLVANREGSANCMTTFKLKTGNRFTESVICFGVYEVSGTYLLKNDTIFFENVTQTRGKEPFYAFALIRPDRFTADTTSRLLYRYKNKADTVGHILWIRKNELPK